MYIKQFFFSIIPFIGFLLGHFFVWHLQKPKTLDCPLFIGLPLLEACIQATQHKINLKISKTVIRDDLSKGTILTQCPKEKDCIKEQQSVYVTVSIHSPIIYAPNFLGKKIDTITQMANDRNIELEIHTLSSSYPPLTVFGQDPLPEKPMKINRLKLYVSKQEETFYIIPNCIGHTLEEVTESFDLNQIPYTCNTISAKNAIIIDQRPVAGSLIAKNNLKMIYLYCAS